jgi:hypothetical protein
MARSRAARAGGGIAAKAHDGIAAGAGADLPDPYGLLRDVLAKTMAWQPIPDDLQEKVAAKWGRTASSKLWLCQAFIICLPSSRRMSHRRLGA